MKLGGISPPSIVFRGRRWSSDAVASTAAGWLDFVQSSIPRSAELTALPLANHPDAVALFFALSSLSLPVVVLPADVKAWRSSPALPPETPVFIPPCLREMAGAEMVGFHTVVLPDARPASSASRPASFLATPGFVNFTSGSTGLPKPVYILTRSFILQTAAIVEACRLSPGAAVAASLPLATHYGLGQALLLPTLLGSTLGLIERFDHRSLLGLFASGSYTYWAGTPTMADMLARAPLSAPAPTVPPICHISTGTLSARVFQAFRDRFGVALRPNYGQTENGFITVDTAPDGEIRPGWVGRPAPGIALRIGDDPLDPYPPGRSGRVWFTSPWYMEGYGFPPRLAARESRHGWWPTRDIGRIDDSGYLKIAGRADDCFKSTAGYLVNPAEIASALIGYPGVTDVVILPISTSAGPLIGALVETERAIEAGEVRAAAGRMLPPWASPQVVALTGRLPRLAGGKPDRRACLAVLRAAAGCGSVPAGSSAPDT